MTRTGLGRPDLERLIKDVEPHSIGNSVRAGRQYAARDFAPKKTAVEREKEREKEAKQKAKAEKHEKQLLEKMRRKSWESEKEKPAASATTEDTSSGAEPVTERSAS